MMLLNIRNTFSWFSSCWNVTTWVSGWIMITWVINDALSCRIIHYFSISIVITIDIVSNTIIVINIIAAVKVIKIIVIS